MRFLSRLFSKNILPGRVGDDEGFLDIDIPLVSIAVGATGELRAVARGEIDGIDMGFAITLKPHWDAKAIDDSSVTVFWGAGTYERTGLESDRFVHFLASRYGLRSTAENLAMLPRIEAEVVGLDSNPAQAREQGAKMKFFFHSSTDERYAEVFTNINIEESFLEFHEKDNEYRTPLLRALSEA